MANDSYRDPGWRSVIGPSLLLALVPIGARLVMRRRAQGSPLLLLRQVFAQFVTALVLVGVVVALFADVGNDSPTVAWASAAVVLAAGLGGWVGAAWARRRPPDCTSPEALLGWYRTRFFLQVAFSQLPALVAFATVLASGREWLYVGGLAFAAVGFARTAPTARNLAADDERLHLAGCPHSLRRLLTEE